MKPSRRLAICANCSKRKTCCSPIHKSGSAANSAEPHCRCDNYPLVAQRPEARWQLERRLPSCVLGNEFARQEKSFAKFIFLWLRYRSTFDFGVDARPRFLQPVDVTIGISRGPAATLQLLSRVWHCQGSPDGPPSFHGLFGPT